MRTGKLFTVIATSVAITMAVAGCGQGSENASVRPAATATAGACARLTAADISQKLEEYREYKRSHETGPGGEKVANYGDWAYASAPVNVTGPGTYTFRFGPLADGADAPKVFSMFPSSGFLGSVGPSEKGVMREVSDADGKRYLLVDLAVFGKVVPCDSLIVFIA